MAGKNPFKIIEAENIRIFNEKGHSKPTFLDETTKSSIDPKIPNTGSPSFPSFG